MGCRAIRGVCGGGGVSCGGQCSSGAAGQLCTYLRLVSPLAAGHLATVPYHPLVSHVQKMARQRNRNAHPKNYQQGPCLTSRYDLIRPAQGSITMAVHHQRDYPPPPSWTPPLHQSDHRGK